MCLFMSHILLSRGGRGRLNKIYKSVGLASFAPTHDLIFLISKYKVSHPLTIIKVMTQLQTNTYINYIYILATQSVYIHFLVHLKKPVVADSASVNGRFVR